jgi:NAD(P)-dependent dehydrogenase (short-subunit alcohol dehydrogenase family)
MSDVSRALTPIAGRLSGRHAIVTGGGTGIGLAVARRLSAEGADLVLMGRRLEPLQNAARDIAAATGGKVEAISCDVTSEDSVAEAFKQARAAFGPVRILVNNAGAAKSGPLARMDLASWQDMLSVNLTGVFLCIKAAMPDFKGADFGRVVNIASTAGLTGYAYVSGYCAAKHGVVGLTRSLALEMARSNVTVNAVCPGYTETEIVATSIRTIVEKTGRDPEAARAELVAVNPQGRLVQPDEVAETVSFLCQDGARSINGQAIAVAGGEVM